MEDCSSQDSMIKVMVMNILQKTSSDRCGPPVVRIVMHKRRYYT